MDNKEQTTKTPVMHPFNDNKKISSSGKVISVLVIMLILGIGTGFGLAKYSASTGKSIPLLPKGSSAQKGKTYGSSDTKTFKDTAEGVLREGGIDGEGQYHLERTGGDSQNVYLISSIVDMSQFTGMKIKVWGQTQQAQKAGWLMDVGKVEVEN